MEEYPHFSNIVQVLVNKINISFELYKNSEFSNSQSIIASVISAAHMKLNEINGSKNNLNKNNFIELEYLNKEELDIKEILFTAYYVSGKINQDLKEYETSMVDFGNSIHFYENSSRDLIDMLSFEFDTPLLFDVTIEFGKNIIAQKKYKNAIDYFNDLFANDEFNIRALYYVGICYDLEKKYHEAIKYFTKGLNHHTNIFHKIPFYLARGKTYHKIKDHDSALFDFNSAVEYSEMIHSRNPEAYFLRGVAYNILTNYSKSIIDLDKAILLKGTNYKYYFERGNVKLRLKNYDDAILDYSKAISLNNMIDSIYVGRSLCYFKKNRKLAIEDLNKAISINSKNYLAYFHKGQVYYNEKDYSSALVNIDKCLEISPKYEKAIELRIKIISYL